MAPPGQVLSTGAQDQLKLTDEQKKKLEDIQKQVDEQLSKVLTEEQQKQLKDMQQGAAGGGGRGGRGGRGGNNPPRSRTRKRDFRFPRAEEEGPCNRPQHRPD